MKKEHGKLLSLSLPMAEIFGDPIPPMAMDTGIYNPAQDKCQIPTLSLTLILGSGVFFDPARM